jgi:hypothetical protein
MPDRVTLEQSRAVWSGQVALVWGATMLATELKVSIPYVHWIVSGLALAFTLPYLLSSPGQVRFPARTPAWLFIVAVCLPTLYGGKVVYSFAEAGKLAIILVGAISIFVARTDLAHYAFRGFVIVVCLNCVFLVGGLLGFASACEMALNRWGTILSWPGSLWRVALTVWVFAGYLLLKRRSVVALTLLSISTVLVFVDGTRTGLFLLFVAAMYLIFILAAEAGRFTRAAFVSAMGLGVVLAGLAYSGILSDEADGQGRGAVGRVNTLLSSIASEGLEGLGAADVIRFQMLQDASDAIRAHPVLGTGIETTVTETIIGPMGIHMTYLQVWGDLGFLGLVAYIWLVWGWIAWVPRVLRRVQTLADPVHRAVYYNALYMLLFFALAGFFHPLSTEWSEWVIFIVAYALVWEVARSGEDITSADPNLRLPNASLG